MQTPDYKSIMSSSLGADLELEECKALAQIMSVRELEAGQVFVEEGTTDHALQLLISGAMEVSHLGPDSRPVVAHMMRPGEYSGVMGFVDGAARKATIRCVEDAVLYELQRGAFEEIMAQYPGITFHIMRAIVRNAYTIIDRINMQTEQMTNYFFKQGGRY